MSAITASSSSTHGLQGLTTGLTTALVTPAASTPRAAAPASPAEPSSGAVSRVAQQAIPAAPKKPTKEQRAAQLDNLASMVLPEYTEISDFSDTYCTVPALLEDTKAGKFCTFTYNIFKEEIEALDIQYDEYGEKLDETLEKTRTVFDSTISVAEKRRGYGLFEVTLTDCLQEDEENNVYRDIDTIATGMEKMQHGALKKARAQRDDPRCAKVEYPVFCEPSDRIIIDKTSPTWRDECALMEKFYTNYQILLEMQLVHTRKFESAFHKLREQLRDMQTDTF